MPGPAKVPPTLLDWYGDKPRVGTIVDYPSAFGRWFLGLSWVVIFFTNKLHWVLAIMNQLVPSLGLCIIVLTVLVRGIMFPLAASKP